MRVALLGFGLIGGSIARALAERSTPDDHDRGWQVVAWTPSGTGPAAAREAGIIAEAHARPEEALGGADLIVLAAPVPDCLALLDDLAGPWREVIADGAVITDVASTKSAIVLRATALGLRFVGGHPMAGRETSGYAAADPHLFLDRPWVVVPSGDEDAEARVEALARATGARPIRLTATTHDAAVAAISHLPLVVSAALVEAVAGRPKGDDTAARDWATAAELVAGGWRDTTRLARGDVAMGTGMLTTNATQVAIRIRDLIGVLEDWLVDLEHPDGPDQEAIAQRLEAARERASETVS